jgi:hypothetical protein
MPSRRASRRAAGDVAVPLRRRSPRATLTLTAALLARLEALGARSNRTRGPYNYTRQLARTLTLFNAVLETSDPRQTLGMPAASHDLVVAALTDPLELESFHIVHLGQVLLELPAFQARAQALAIEPQDFCAQLTGYPFAERLHLVATAPAHHAPRRG